MWPSLIAKAKEGGLDVVQTYVFWNLHEPQPGEVSNYYIHICTTPLSEICNCVSGSMISVEDMIW